MKILTGSRLRCLAVSLFFLGSGFRPAVAQLLGPEFQVNSYAPHDQGAPAVAMDGSGNFVVVWKGYSQDGDKWGVFGQRFDATGTPVGSELQVNSFTTDDQASPDVAMDGSGQFVVVWHSYAQDGANWGVIGQRFDSTGGALGSEFQVNSHTTSYQYEPVVAADSAGRFVVVWMTGGQDGWGSGLFGQRYDSAGNLLGSEFQVNSHTTNHQYSAAVAVDGSGNFVVAWESNYQDGSGFGIFAQRFDSTGARAGSEFQISSHTSDFQSYPSVAADSAGNFVVVWESDYQDGSDLGVFGQRFDSLGTKLGSEFQVNSYTTSRQSEPEVGADDLGNFVVVWTDERAGRGVVPLSETGLSGQRFNSSGAKVGSELQVNSYTTGIQSAPAVAADSSGNLVVVWRSYGQDGWGDGVFGQRGIVPLFADGFESGKVCAWSSWSGISESCP